MENYGFLEDCHNYSSVSGATNVGGIVGRTGNMNRRIIKCSNNGDVTASSNYASGIVGYFYSFQGDQKFNNCYNTGAVSGANYVGGIIGYWDYPKNEFYNCFNIGYIKSTKNYVGGLVGYINNSMQNSCSFYNCFNIGLVDSTGNLDIEGAIAGFANGYSSTKKTKFIRCYWGKDCNLTNCYGAGNEYTETSLSSKKENIDELAKSKEWYTTSSNWNITTKYQWDFENVWMIKGSENNGYPILKNQYYTYQGEGTEESPYLIDSERALRLMSNNINSGVDNSAYFKQTSDICIGEEEWTPIGNSLSIRFSGVYDGLGHFISGIRIMSPEGDCKGVFGCIGGTDSSNYAVVKNLNIINSYVQGFNHVGSIAGCLYSNYGKIENCTSKSTIVIATGDCAGGICGTAVYDSIINNCSNSASVKGKRNIGGIVGELNSGSQVSNCFNYGNLEGETENVGGIVGLLRSNTIVSNSISNCVITSVKGVGSIIGSGSGTIRNCSGYGMLYGVDEGKCGAILGDANGMPKLENCSFFGNSNLEIGFFCGNTSTTSWMTDGCFTTINNRKSMLAGDYSEWSIVPNMNYDLPMQNELYSIAIGNFTSNEIIDYLKNLGFGLSS